MRGEIGRNDSCSFDRADSAEEVKTEPGLQAAARRGQANAIREKAITPHNKQRGLIRGDAEISTRTCVELISRIEPSSIRSMSSACDDRVHARNLVVHAFLKCGLGAFAIGQGRGRWPREVEYRIGMECVQIVGRHSHNQSAENKLGVSTTWGFS